MANKDEVFELWGLWNEFANAFGLSPQRVWKETGSKNKVYHGIVAWMEQHGELWRDEFQELLVTMQHNTWLRGKEGFTPSLYWLFVDSGKGTGVDKIYEGRYDTWNEQQHKEEKSMHHDDIICVLDEWNQQTESYKVLPKVFISQQIREGKGALNNRSYKLADKWIEENPNDWQEQWQQYWKAVNDSSLLQGKTGWHPTFRWLLDDSQPKGRGIDRALSGDYASYKKAEKATVIAINKPDELKHKGYKTI